MAKYYTRITGLNEVQENLNKELAKIKRRSLAGLIEASVIVRRSAEPMTPVDWGNLVNSWFVVTARAVKGGRNAAFKGPKASEISSQHTRTLAEAQKEARRYGTIPILIMGYSANYAAAVHEMLGADFTKHGKMTAQAKFLEKALQRNKGRIVAVVAKNTKVK